VLILKRVKVFCFDTLLQVLILKGLTLEQIFSATGTKQKKRQQHAGVTGVRDGSLAAGMQAQC
jgi:hypothetical protein